MDGFLELAVAAVRDSACVVFEGRPGGDEQHAALTHVFAQLLSEGKNAVFVTACHMAGNTCLATRGSPDAYAALQVHEAFTDVAPPVVDALCVHRADLLVRADLGAMLREWRAERGDAATLLVLSVDVFAANDAAMAQFADECARLFGGLSVVSCTNKSGSLRHRFPAKVCDLETVLPAVPVCAVDDEVVVCQTPRGELVVGGMLARFEAAKRIMGAFPAAERTTMLLAFALVPAALDQPRLETYAEMRQADARCTALDWFNETHKPTSPDGYAHQELPRLSLFDAGPGTVADIERRQAAHTRLIADLNRACFEALPGEARTFPGRRENSRDLDYWIASQPEVAALEARAPVLLPDELDLKLGMPVMLLFALGPVPAGTLGMVVGFEGGRLPEVTFAVGRPRLQFAVERITQVVRLPHPTFDLHIKVWQLPLCPAFWLSSVLLDAVRLRGGVAVGVEGCDVERVAGCLVGTPQLIAVGS